MPDNVQNIDLNLLTLDESTQVRAALDQDTIDEYAEHYAAGGEFPPVDVFGDGECNFYLVDGWHRFYGARKAGRKQIACRVWNGSLLEAQWFAVSANKLHGLRRSNADKRRAVEAALRHPKGSALSDRLLAEHCGVSDKTVGAVRAEMEASAEIPQPAAKRQGADGRLYSARRVETAPAEEDVDAPQEWPAEDACGELDEAGDEDESESPEPIAEPEPLKERNFYDVIATCARNCEKSGCAAATVNALLRAVADDREAQL